MEDTTAEALEAPKTQPPLYYTTRKVDCHFSLEELPLLSANLHEHKYTGLIKYRDHYETKLPTEDEWTATLSPTSVHLPRGEYPFLIQMKNKNPRTKNYDFNLNPDLDRAISAYIMQELLFFNKQIEQLKI